MKNCPKCNAQLNDDAAFCTNCGNAFQPQQPQQQYQQQNNTYVNNNQYPNGVPYPQQPVPVVNPYDHTAEFSPEDVHDNKLFALLCYLTSFVGIIVALLAKKSNDSAYLSFHIKQALKIAITEFMVTFIAALLCWTCIIPFAAGVVAIIIVVVTIISFINTCANKSIEVPIIRNLTFLN